MADYFEVSTDYLWSAALITRKSTGRRAAQCAAPTVQPVQTGRAGEAPAPRRNTGSRSPGTGPRAAFGRSPHPPPSGAPSPKGEGLLESGIPLAFPYFRGRGWPRRIRMGPPEFAPVPLVRQTQARRRNRTRPNFCKPRPQWAGRNRRPPLRFCAPEGFCPPQGVTPVMGVRGKATMSTKCSSGAVPGGVLVTLPPWAK